MHNRFMHSVERIFRTFFLSKGFSGSECFQTGTKLSFNKNIVHAANSVIDKNKGQLKKNVWTENDLGEKFHSCGL